MPLSRLLSFWVGLLAGVFWTERPSKCRACEGHHDPRTLHATFESFTGACLRRLAFATSPAPRTPRGLPTHASPGVCRVVHPVQVGSIQVCRLPGDFRCPYPARHGARGRSESRRLRPRPRTLGCGTSNRWCGGLAHMLSDVRHEVEHATRSHMCGRVDQVRHAVPRWSNPTSTPLCNVT